MFDDHGAMHGFTEKNKVLIFQSFCQLPQRFYPSFKKQFLSLFDYNGRLLSQSEDLKVYFFQTLKESQHQDALTALIDILAKSTAPWHSMSDFLKKCMIQHVLQLSPLA